MSDAGATRLATFLEAANRGAAQEIVMQSDQVPFAVADGAQSALGPATTSSDLFDMLSEVLSDEQQVELAVGNLVEFTLNVAGVGWHLVTEPGVEGVSVRGRVSGGMSSDASAGRSVQIPAVDAGPEYAPGRSSNDLPPVLDDELDIELSDAPPPAADPFAGDPFDDDPFADPPPTASSPPPAPSQSGMDFGVSGSAPEPPTDGAAPHPGGYEPFDSAGPVDGDPLGGLDAPNADTRQDMPAQGDLPPVIDDDEDGFTADFAFVDGEVPSSASAPNSAAGQEHAGVERAVSQMPSTRETERVADGDEHGTVDESNDAPSPRKHSSSGATVQISAAEAANEMARRLSSQGGTQELNRRSGTGTTFRAIAPERATWEVVSGAEQLDKLTRFVGEGSLVHVLGTGALEMAGDEPSLCFLDGDSPEQNLDATEGHAPGTWVILSLDDPSPWLGWILRRLEEGHRVLVESRARTTEGAWRALMGVDGGRRAESWVAHHAHLGISLEDERWKLLRRRS